MGSPCRPQTVHLDPQSMSNLHTFRVQVAALRVQVANSKVSTQSQNYDAEYRNTQHLTVSCFRPLEEGPSPQRLLCSQPTLEAILRPEGSHSAHLRTPVRKTWYLVWLLELESLNGQYMDPLDSIEAIASACHRRINYWL